ncbi:hypothetical protein U1Q18_002094, partial [Sarracenia purpurea var. burkii]
RYIGLLPKVFFFPAHANRMHACSPPALRNPLISHRGCTGRRRCDIRGLLNLRCTLRRRNPQLPPLAQPHASRRSSRVSPPATPLRLLKTGIQKEPVNKSKN